MRTNRRTPLTGGAEMHQGDAERVLRELGSGKNRDIAGGARRKFRAHLVLFCLDAV